MQPCLFCSKEYKASRLSKYCSVGCRRNAWKVANREISLLSNRLSAQRKRIKENINRVQPDPRLCINCGNPFYPNKYHPEQKCCTIVCNNKYFKSINKNDVLRWKRESNFRHRDHISRYNAQYKDKLRFGGNQLRVLRRDNYTCQVCGYVAPFEKKNKGDDVVVHHIDFSGRDKKPNNRIQNLQTLCRACHIRLHTHKL